MFCSSCQEISNAEGAPPLILEVFLTESLRIAQENGQQGCHTYRQRIVEIRKNVHRTEIGQTGCQEHLHAIRNQSLNHA